MFNTTSNKTDLNQISLTGMRAVILLGLLIIEPRSLDEIRKAFLDYKIIDDSHSNDILRIDINTLKHMGCEISRSSQKTGYKYVLGEHPFSLKLSQEDIKTVKKAYGALKENANISLLIEYHKLFEKIAKHISNKEVREEFLGISELKHCQNLSVLQDLIIDCEQERFLELVYSSPSVDENKVKKIIAQKLVFKNNKIYLYGFDTEIEKQIVLIFNRIKKILSRKLHKGNALPKPTVVKFNLKNVESDILSDEETVLEVSDSGYLVEGAYYDEFIATQRILSFGCNCTVVEPEDFKTKIITKLKEMRKIYE